MIPSLLPGPYDFSAYRCTATAVATDKCPILPYRGVARSGVFHMETPSPYTSFGAKGIGEGGAVGPPAAIMSAVNDALWGIGVELCDLPLSPQRILDAIDAVRAA